MAKDNPIKEYNNPNEIFDNNIENVLHSAMIPYAEYVILDRALPRVEDGLKPVQRRILYSMSELGVLPDKPYRKSARIVGDCLGKYHPHGDSSIYGAMVRMAQPFNMRMTLVDGHGNYGSVDGDGAAAMRYTEARLTPLAMELLRDIEKDTVRYSLNFDDSAKEPDMLPGRFPNLLVNGASGIAVGLATNIPPHNLAETVDAVIAYLDNKNITLKELMKVIKGPDFPTGGFIVAGEELEKAYLTGKGKITLRAKIFVENAENDKKNIIISEFPYQVNKAQTLQKILELKEEKKEQLAGVYDICDESDRSGIRAVIKVKKDYNTNDIINEILKSTDLQTTFGINMVAIAGGKPRQMGLIDIISYYADYQKEVLLKRTKFDLNEAKQREHILEGLVVCVKNIDEVIKIIRSSQNTGEARSRLRARFNLSEAQAQAILDMRLARLTSLEITKLEDELAALKKLIKELQEIIDSKKALSELLKKELLSIKRQFKDERRSVIVNDIAEIEETGGNENAVEDYAVVQNGGLFKRVPYKNYNMSNRQLSEKSGINDIATLLIETQNNAQIMMFSNLGNCYKAFCGAFPECKWKEKGVPLKSFVREAEPEEKIVFMFPYISNLPFGSLIFFTKQGYVKKTAWEEYALSKSSFQAIKLKEGDEVINVENDTGNTSLLFVTAEGMCLNADKFDLPQQGRVSSGVHGIYLNAKDYTVFAGQVSKEGEVIAVTDRAMFKRIPVTDFEVIARYRKGVKLTDLNKDTGSKIMLAGYATLPFEIAVSDSEKNLITLSTDDLPIEGRTQKAKGVKDYRRGFEAVKVCRHLSSGQYITVQTDIKL